MPTLNGLEATRRIHEISFGNSNLSSRHMNFPHLLQIAQDSGAQGCVLKSETFDVLTKATETGERLKRVFPFDSARVGYSPGLEKRRLLEVFMV